jgi:PAS domain S-box-containing protein
MMNTEDRISNLESQVRELAFLHETSQVLTASLDLNSVLESLMTQVRDYFQVDAVSVALLDKKTYELVFRVAVGAAADAVIGLHLPSDQGIAGWVARTGEIALIPDVYADKRFYTGIDDTTDFQTQAMLAVPIKPLNDKGEVIGVIEVLNPQSGSFDQDAQRLLESVADMAAAAIRNAELYERARQAERRYESIFNESTDPILVVDMEGKILELNQQAVELLDRPCDQLVGAEPTEVFSGMPISRYREKLKQLQAGKQLTIEMEIPSKGENRILDVHMTQIDYGGRQAIQWIGHDITEQVALERLRDDLTHMIIHDLRNPLGNIMNSLQMLYNAFQEKDETLPMMEVLEISIRNSKKLNQLIDSLLDLRRLEAGQADLNKTGVHPQRLVDEALELIEPLTEKKDQELILQIPSDLPTMFVDQSMLVRVMTNLLDNAVKYTPVGGTITLRIEPQEANILFTVSDTGSGIPPEAQQYVFDRFARLNNAKGVRGIGLGLAFCKLAVEAHGGQIWVESEKDQGSQFKFTIPLEDE